MKKMTRLYIEGDFGQDFKIFTSKATARNWLNNSPEFQRFLDETGETIESLEADTIIQYDEVTVD